MTETPVNANDVVRLEVLSAAPEIQNDFPHIDLDRQGTATIRVIALINEGSAVRVVTSCKDVDNNVDIEAKRVAWNMRLILGMGDAGIEAYGLRRTPNGDVEQTWRLVPMTI